MTVFDQVRAHQQQLTDLQEHLGLLSVQVFESAEVEGPADPIFVVDLDRARQNGYADRYFEAMFGLQRIFARPIDMWEQHMFEKDGQRMQLRSVPLMLQHAA